MKNSEYNKISFDSAFSEARMKPYFDRYPGNEKKAVQHYEQNIRLAESLEPSLSIFEVTLRNAVIRELVKMTGRQDWYEFLKSDPALKDLYKYVTTAGNHIKRRGETVTIDKINGELTLGFWVSLFNAEYEMVLWKYLRKAIPLIFPRTGPRCREFGPHIIQVPHRSPCNRKRQHECCGDNYVTVA